MSMEDPNRRIKLKVTTNAGLNILCTAVRSWKAQQLLAHIEKAYREVKEDQDEETGKSNYIKVVKIKKDGYRIAASQIVGDVFEDNDEITCEIIQGTTENKRKQKENKIHQKEKLIPGKEQNYKAQEEKSTDKKLIWKQVIKRKDSDEGEEELIDKALIDQPGKDDKQSKINLKQSQFKKAQGFKDKQKGSPVQLKSNQQKKQQKPNFLSQINLSELKKKIGLSNSVKETVNQNKKDFMQSNLP